MLEILEKIGGFRGKSGDFRDFSLKIHLCISLAFILKLGIDLTRFERWNVQPY
jgi:hypothetical protein